MIDLGSEDSDALCGELSEEQLGTPLLSPLAVEATPAGRVSSCWNQTESDVKM